MALSRTIAPSDLPLYGRWLRRALRSVAATGVLAVLAACGGGNEEAAPAAPAVASDSDTTGQGDDMPAVPGTPAPVFEPDPALGASKRFMLAPDQWITVDERAPASAPASGTATPTLLAIHDLGASSVQWRALIDASPSAWRWLGIDLRGHGNASDPDTPASTDTHLADLAALLDARNERDLVVVGSGLGARLAVRLAARLPQRIAKVVLIAAGDGSATSEALERLQARIERAPVDSGFVIDWRAAGGIIDDALGPPAFRLTTATWRAGLESLTTGLTPPAGGGPVGLPAQPVLRLLGGDDGLLDPAAADALASALPADVLQRRDAGGRYPELDAPAWTVERIARFLAPRGTLHDAREMGGSSIGQTNALTDGRVERALVRDVTGEAFCDVRFVQIEYQTVGAAGESTNASAAVGVPTGGHPECQGPRPLLLYAHGTSADRDYDFFTSAEGFGGVVLAMFAARGYLVVAPEYTGYGRSWLDYHPYLQAEPQSADMIDALRAAETWFLREGLARRELFVSGYSQGGHVAMATHRRIERDLVDEFTVTGSFPMSGPYALERTFSQLLGGRSAEGQTALVPFVVDGLLRADPALAPADRYFNAPYDTTARDLFPGSMDAEEALAAGRIPPYLLAAHGQPHLLRETFVTDYLAETENPLRRALTANSLLDWAPRAPLGLCGGGKDPLVFFDNSFVARDAFAERGVIVPLFDLNNSATLPGGRTNSIYLRFRSLFLFTDDLSGYHAALAPFCAHYARDFFASLRR